MAHYTTQPIATPSALPYGPPTSIHDIVQISPITITPGNDRGSYSFHYDIRNDVPPARLQKVYVVLHRHVPVSPAYFPDADAPAPVCVTLGKPYAVDINRVLPSGTYGYAAKWTDKIKPNNNDYNCFEGSEECDPEHDGKEFTVA